MITGDFLFYQFGALEYIARMDDQRKAITQLLHETGQSMAELSRKCGLNHAYFEQYLKRGSPRELPERTLRLLEDVHSISRESLREGRLVYASGRPERKAQPTIKSARHDSTVAGNPTREAKPMAQRIETVWIEEIQSHPLRDDTVLIQLLDASGVRFQVKLPLEEIRRFREQTRDY